MTATGCEEATDRLVVELAPSTIPPDGLNRKKFGKISSLKVPWGPQMAKIGLKGCPREAKVSPSSPKEAQREAQMPPRGAQGSPKEPLGGHFGVNSGTKEVKSERK